ncbi:uncharacterized protein V6R79_018103 [Siganus canaliculatus]
MQQMISASSSNRTEPSVKELEAALSSAGEAEFTATIWSSDLQTAERGGGSALRAGARVDSHVV